MRMTAVSVAAFAERGFGTQFHERGDGGAAAIDGQFLQRIREGKEKEEDRALEGMIDVGGAERGEDHKEIDVDRAAEQGTNALDRGTPTAGEISGEEEPEIERGKQVKRGAESAEEHEEERGDDAEDVGLGPVDAGKKAGHGGRAAACRSFPVNGVGLDRAGRIGDQRLAEGDGKGGLAGHRFQDTARDVPHKPIIARQWSSELVSSGRVSPSLGMARLALGILIVCSLATGWTASAKPVEKPYSATARMGVSQPGEPTSEEDMLAAETAANLKIYVDGGETRMRSDAMACRL